MNARNPAKRDRLDRGRRTTIDFESEAVARLLDAAEAVFAENGFDAASMDAIAALAGLNKATIYYHIKNKEKLYQEVLKRHFARFADRLERELANCGDPVEGLRGVVRIHAQEFGRSIASTRTIGREIAGGLSRAGAEVHAVVWRILAVTRRFLDAAVEKRLTPPLDAAAVHHMLVGPILVNALVVPIVAPQGAPPADWTPPASDLTALAELIIDTVIPGLAAAADVRP